MTSDDPTGNGRRPDRSGGLPAYVAPAAVIGWLSILVLFATWLIGGWIGALGDRITAFEGRETNVGNMLAALDAKIDRRSEAIEARLSETNARIDRVIERIDGVVDRISQLQAMVTELQAQFTQLQKDVTQLQADMDLISQRLDQIVQRLEAADGRSPAGMDGPDLRDGVRRAEVPTRDLQAAP